jgi:hypothetical protein
MQLKNGLDDELGQNPTSPETVKSMRAAVDGWCSSDFLEFPGVLRAVRQTALDRKEHQEMPLRASEKKSNLI